MPQTPITREDAEAFIDALYRYVLTRDNVEDSEFVYWTDLLLKTDDPINIFFHFLNSEENQRRLAKMQTTRTMYEDGHFYSPVVDTNEIVQEEERIFGNRDLLGVSLNAPRQIETFQAISRHFNDIPFSDENDGKNRYYYNNTSYGFGDACVYWGMLGAFKPARIIEIGCGFTSALALDAIDVFKTGTKCTFIDPYPALAHKVIGDLAPQHVIIPKPVQHIDPALVGTLEKNDIFFIDSSHVVKTGSDVYFEVCELLPRLKPGVIVHFHDMFYPFEYPKPWVVSDNKSWNELYFVQTFLQYNNAFEVIYFNDYFAKVHTSELAKGAPKQVERIKINPGGGLWLRRL